MITRLFPKDLWKYVDSDTDNEYKIPEALTFDLIKDRANSFKNLNTNKRIQWSNLKSFFKHHESNYYQYLSEVVSGLVIAE
jgi:hypothetical protein